MMTSIPLTPYELVFGHPLFEEDRFPGIREEAEARGIETWVPERFLHLGTVGELLRELVPEGGTDPGNATDGAETAGARATGRARRPGDAVGTGGSSGIAGEAFQRHGLLLFHAYHFWLFGRRLFVLEESAARALVEAAPEVGAWELTAPHPAGYLRLPRNLFWARVDGTAAPEPADGFFWTMVGVEDPLHPPYRRLDVLLVLGMRADRPGFSTIPAGSELVAAPTGHWADADARPGGPDFGNILPGGELQRWYGLETEVELLKLVSRIFWQVAERPASLGGPEPEERAEGTRGAAAGPRDLPPTSLPAAWIRGVEAGAEVEDDG